MYVLLSSPTTANSTRIDNFFKGRKKTPQGGALKSQLRLKMFSRGEEEAISTGVNVQTSIRLPKPKKD
jgi:hypothetical protein